MRNICSDEFLNRVDKSGFNAPFDIWVRGPFRDFVLDVFTSEKFLNRGIYDETKFRTVLDGHMSGRENHMMLLWQALNLELWLNEWIDK